ncbi:hypothetical protein LCGC14_0709700 [marine sediment metagenome]|uniref:glutamate--tRNA ligase n=1 Tax=marine sediment metagenome TaxID=412755 RepID=A0A0F9R0X8_9ZZZZ
MEEKEIEQIFWLSGLKNAVKFNGTPNKKAIMGKIMAKSPNLKSQAKTIIPILDQVIDNILKLNLEEQKTKLLELDSHALDKKELIVEKKVLPELPNLSKFNRIVMRLAPYPSGALHIGNARMIVLNYEYVKRYNGELILFFDDTIGSPKSLRDSPKAKYVLPESYDLITEGLEWLGISYSKIYYKSDRLEIFYQYCEQLIKDNLAYVCFCSADMFREKFKKEKKNCPHRNHSVDKNLEEWNAMLDKKYHEGEAVVRLKTGMVQKDPALRDQIIMRISEAEHPKVGTKYNVWPMLEFSWAIDDHLIGVTHILRGIDLVKEDFIENFIWDHFEWNKAEFLHYGKISFANMKLSKTEARNNIQNGVYKDWDDPQTWSLQSLKKRGIKPEALSEVLIELGMSLTGINFSVNWLYSKNKDIIDDISNRYFYVEDPLKIIITGISVQEYIAKPLLHPTHPEKGKREIRCNVKNSQLTLLISFKDANNLKINQIIRLKDLINIQVNSIDLDKKIIKSTFHTKELNRDFPIIQWVHEEENIKVSIFNPNGSVSSGNGEISLLKIPMNQTIQFERFGFVNPIEIKQNCLFCYFTH